jgi:hypothetical protein
MEGRCETPTKKPHGQPPLEHASNSTAVHALLTAPMSTSWSRLAVVLTSVCGASCNGSVGGEPPCCPTPTQCPDDAVEVDICETDDCFTVEGTGCCEPVECVPAASCTAGCLFNELEVPACVATLDTFTCRTIESCGQVLHCEGQIECNAQPVCDPDDTFSTSYYCPPGANCYTVEICGNTIVCIESDGGGGGGGGG